MTIIMADNAQLSYKLPRGFSLVELMVALALSLFLIGGVLATFIAARTTAIETEILSRAQENIRFTSDYLIRDLRNAGFRDQLTLTLDHFGELGDKFAEVSSVNSDANKNNVLVVRYAGRGTCGDVFGSGAQQQIIENRYSVNNGELQCDGTTINESGEASPDPAVILSSGIEEIEFVFLDVNGNPVPAITECGFPKPDASTPGSFLPPDCIGVRLYLTFEGLPQQQIELNASFRNVILSRLTVN